MPEIMEISLRNFTPQFSKITISVFALCGLAVASPIFRSQPVQYYNIPSLSEKTAENRVSNDILQSMNLDINPCEDFYQFACGNYGNRQKILPFIANTGRASMELELRNNTLLKPDILESLTKFDGAAEKAKDFYTSCSQIWGRRMCFEETRRFFPDIIARLFTQNVLTRNKVEKVRQLFPKIASAFREKVLSLEWLDSEGKQSLIDKLRNITFVVGATSSILNVTLEKDVYKNVSVSKESELLEYMNNLWTMKEFESTRVWPIWLNNDLKEWNRIFDAGAYYNRFENFVFLSAGILQEPFFREDDPDVIQYSKLGFLLAHEYSHAFVKHLTDVFTPYIIEASNNGQPDIKSSFYESGQCLMYRNYTLPNSNFTWSGKTFLGEDLSDILGVQIAFETFQNSNKNEIENQSLPGLERFTMEQVYFISAAQFWCSAYENEEIERLDLEGNFDKNHSPNQFRVLIEMSNSMDFVKSFSCPVGSNYNPRNKCGNFF